MGQYFEVSLPRGRPQSPQPRRVDNGVPVITVTRVTTPSRSDVVVVRAAVPEGGSVAPARTPSPRA